MGGAITTGNQSPVAEFNILCDPEAASYVFHSDVKVVMVPLEVTHTALATDKVLNRIKMMDSKFSTMIVDLLLFFKDTYKRVFDFESPPVHDACAVAYVIKPSIFKTRFMRVEVETGNSICQGQTVCDVWATTKLPPNVHVAEKMDPDAFWDLCIPAFEAANRASPLA